MLLVLVYRSGGRERGSRFFFAACIFIANCAGLLKNLSLLANPNLSVAFEYRLRALGFVAGALCPYGIIAIWRANAISPLRRRVGKWVVWYSTLSGAAIAGLIIAGALWPSSLSLAAQSNWLLNQDAVGNLTIFNGLLVVVTGGILLLPGALKGPTDQIAVSLMIVGLLISATGAVLSVHSARALMSFAQVARFQGIILLVIGVLFYFSHFRAADIFAKYALRLLLASVLSIGAAVGLMKPIYRIAHEAPYPLAASILAATMLICISIGLYLWIGTWIDIVVERRIFGKRDPRQVVVDFRYRIGLLDNSSGVIALLCSVATSALAMQQEDLSVEQQATAEEALAADTVVRIPSSGQTAQLEIAIRDTGRTLLSSEIDLLHELALHAGRRFDDLEREQERIERVRTEGRLSSQLVEAELRALRSQINPHFLFNSLNTIASLVASEPDKAEKITVRLSSIFRYVLTHSDRPFTSLGEEMEFLRTFLEIEQIRFGERLAVTFDIDPASAPISIPSLILQPLVENAIKHGIAPKIGKSHLTIRAVSRGDFVQIDIEDDGIGLRSKEGASPMKNRMTNGTGIGLQNIRERLSTLYGTMARIDLADQQSAGVRATIVLPVNGGRDANPNTAG
jgi:two-component system LytT family sensor kinase